MKKYFKLIGIIAVVAVIGLLFAACSDDPDGGGNGTYTGTANGVTYTLKIESGGLRAASTPTQGDRYTLTASGKTSTGTVTKVVGGVLTLSPNADPSDEFTVTVSGNDITAMSGNITWDDGTANEAPTTLTPSGGTGGAGITPDMANAAPLTENIWAECKLPTSSSVQWFKFTASASTHYIHRSPYGMQSGTLTIQVYNSSGATLGTNSTNYTYGYFEQKNLTPGQTYYLSVKVYDGIYVGTYRIGFTKSDDRPFDWPSDFTPLATNQWNDGDFPEPGIKWFTITATSSIEWIHFELGTLPALFVDIYTDSRAQVGDEIVVANIIHNQNDYKHAVFRSLTPGQTYYIRMRTNNYDGGTYRILFNAAFYPLGVIPLTDNQWYDGDLLQYGVRWFSFAATASTQFIHAAFGTLTDLNVQMYDNTGEAVGSEISFGSSTIRTSRTLEVGQTYYITVRPRYRSYSGTYQIAFNTEITPPGTSLTPLTVNQLANGDISTSGGEQWFKFTATASTQYIHAAFGTLTDLYVQVYDSTGKEVGSETNLYNASTNKYISRPVTEGQNYYIRVRPYRTSIGTYQIAFNTAVYPPGTTLNPLTADQWSDGELPTNYDQQWFTFTATSSTQYIHVTLGTLTQPNVQVYDNTSEAVESEAYFNTSSTYQYFSRSLTAGKTYYIRVRSEQTNRSGTYRILFNTTFYSPGGTTPNSLTANQWADGDLPVGGQQWYTFTATASTQYIHVAFGTLEKGVGIRVQVFDSGGTVVSGESWLTGNSSDTNTSRLLTEGQTYYIRVRLGSSSKGDTYRIAFNTSSTAPAQ